MEAMEAMKALKKALQTMNARADETVLDKFR